ncbi:WYL domain-containing protein [uncultured Duncaniella sp.]|uniref:helix-turn-helix transcriptional regulator n=1 Tax=uncultured Duncaniella sp. TaxID=2768039 RepID=UPI0025A99AAF|nr:WYL domain-containing protein [uncultured Duncaniella sp.]
MPVNRNALIRYKTIDNCLRRRNRRWTLDELIEACSDALYEYEGIVKGISRRTVQMDIQMMRSDKLGYNAPIEVYENKYYRYSDPEYSITNSPLMEDDLKLMGDTVEVLRQFGGFSAFSGMEDVLGRLEDYVSSIRHNRKPVILLETNDSLKGLKFIDPLYKAILSRKPVTIVYKSFKARDIQRFIFSPFFLKEYRNRWFVYGWRNGADMIYNLALDRIHDIGEASGEVYRENTMIDQDEFFDNLIGVTKNVSDKVHNVRFWANSEQVPYIETKPLHKSQFVVQRNEDGSAIFQMEVILNYELEKELLGFGEGIKVLAPRDLAHKMSMRLRKAAENYG